MVKKKSIKKLAVSPSFFSMHRHARWLLGLFIVVSIVFLGVHHKSDLDQEHELNRLLIRATNSTISWKTYKNPVGKFMIQYPANWKLVESHEKSNREVDDPKEINTATLSGSDGEIVLAWGPMGFGGRCDDKNHTTMRLKEMKVSICSGVTNGKYYWDQIYPADRDPAFGARATASDTETGNVITNIFATLSFDK